MQTLSRTGALNPDERRAQAYAAVFSANGTREDVDIVLVDLAVYSGFYQPQPPGVGEADRHYMAGRASVFAWLISNIAAVGGGAREIGALHVAALHEMTAEQKASMRAGRLPDEP